MKKIKRLTLFGLLSFVSVGLIGTTCAFKVKDNLNEVKATKEYVLRLDETTDINNIYTKDGTKIDLEFVNYTPVSGALGKFDQINMKTPINGINSILFLCQNYKHNLWGNYFYEYKDGTRRRLFDYNPIFEFNSYAGSESCIGRLPNIVDIVSNKDEVINWIEITYTCEEDQKNLSMYYQTGNEIQVIKQGAAEPVHTMLKYANDTYFYDRITYTGEVILEVGDRFRIKRQDGFYLTTDNTECINANSDYSTPISSYYEVQAESWMLVKLRSKVSIMVDAVGIDLMLNEIEYEKLPQRYTFTLNFNFANRIPSGYRPVIYSNIPDYEGAQEKMSDAEKIKAMDKTSCITTDPNRKSWKLEMPGRLEYGEYHFSIYVLEYGKPYDETMLDFGFPVELIGYNNVTIGEFLKKEKSYYNLHIQNEDTYYPQVGDFGLYDINNPLNNWIYKKKYGTENEYQTIQGIYGGTVLEARQLLNGELYIGKLIAKPDAELYGITIKDNKIYTNKDVMDLRLYITSYEGDATTSERYVNIEVVSYPTLIIG